MRILYAIQGTGNGHLSRAKEIIPALRKRARVDVLVSGTQSDIDLPFPVKYKLKGFSFVFGKKGGIDYFKTIKNTNVITLIKEIKTCKIKYYDLIINDFEPISAWACYFSKRLHCVSLSHQSALLSAECPKPKYSSFISKLILKYYAPTSINYSFHFKRYAKNIFTPVIRKGIRQQEVKEKNFYVVYLPAYSDEKIISVLSKIKHTHWQVFSKHATKKYKIKNINVKLIGDNTFDKNLASAKGVICGAGFETQQKLFI